MKLFQSKKRVALEAHLGETIQTKLDERTAFSFDNRPDDEAERTGYSNYSYWRSTLQVFLKNRAALSLLCLLLIVLAFTFIQPYLPGQYDANTINNHPETGMQLSNVPPSTTTVAKTVPAGEALSVSPVDADWCRVSSVSFAIQKRIKFNVIEHTGAWSKIEHEGKTGYVENTNLKLPEDPSATPYECLSNFKTNVYSSPAGIASGGGALYVEKAALEMKDAATGEAVTTRETQLRTLPTRHAHWFGTNNIGQDLWARVWSGTRTSLFIGFLVALVEALVGIMMGVLWGYVRKLDKLMTEIYNVLDNIPTTIVLILISYVLRPSIQTLILAMCLTGWLNMALFIRNQIVIIRDRDYNLASRCLGTSTFRIIARNLLPYLVSVITLRMALAIPVAIGNEVFITYIGLGLPVSIPSLGNLLNEGRQLISSPSLRYQLLFPAAVLSMITISFYIIGNAFADAADPKNHI